MNTLKLKNLGVQELSAQEKREVRGGLAPLGWVLLIACCALLQGDSGR